MKHVSSVTKCDLFPSVTLPLWFSV